MPIGDLTNTEKQNKGMKGTWAERLLHLNYLNDCHFRPYALRFISCITVPLKKGLNFLSAFVRGESIWVFNGLPNSVELYNNTYLRQ